MIENIKKGGFNGKSEKGFIAGSLQLSDCFWDF
jgi:hypothetical protein